MEKLPVKTIVVKEDGLIYASNLEKPIEPNINSPAYVMLDNYIYKQALNLFTSSLIKVENKEFLLQNKIIPYIIKEETVAAPYGLVMDVKEGTTPEGYYKFAICSFLPDKEQEKEIKELTVDLNTPYFQWLQWSHEERERQFQRLGIPKELLNPNPTK